MTETWNTGPRGIAVYDDAGAKVATLEAADVPSLAARPKRARLMAAAPRLLAALKEILEDSQAWQIGLDTRHRAKQAIAAAEMPDIRSLLDNAPDVKGIVPMGEA